MAGGENASDEPRRYRAALSFARPTLSTAKSGSAARGKRDREAEGETEPDEAAEAERAARRVGWIVVESGRARVGLTADTDREVAL
jgi:hypothetical protein